MTWEDRIFLWVFFVLVFGVPAAVVWASTRKKGAFATFDWSSLWIYHDKVDKFAVIIMGTWWLHSCSIILWTLKHAVTTADYVTYMGWAIPLIAKMWAPKNGPPEPKP